MKFATFHHAGASRVGIVDVTGGRIRPIDAASMAELIARSGGHTPPVVLDEHPGLPLAGVELLAPLPHPAKNIICVGKNYADHAREFSSSGYEAGAAPAAGPDPYPAVFTKPASAIVGPGATVSLHAHLTSEVDYEGELAVVIGRAGRDIARADAMQYVWGYTIINDVTARDRQRNHRQWFLGKGLDTFCPMGPWIVTADEIAVDDMRLETRVNGELRQSASLRDLVFDIPALIASISAGMSLAPGDIIATGTPAGVGIGFTPPKFLRPGDSVAVTVSGVGTLTNPFA